MLNSHMDVVPPADGWDTDPYDLVIQDDRAYGRGSTDAKGPLACLTMAVKRIIENPEGVNGTIVYTAVVDEESHSTGARTLVKHPQVYGDYCIVGEPTLSRVAVSHNGSLRPVIVAEGLSVHASNPELGINAIRIAAYISQLVDEIAEEISGIVHPTTGKPSIAITMISGGVQENVVPDRCEITIDRRMYPGRMSSSCASGLADCAGRLRSISQAAGSMWTTIWSPPAPRRRHPRTVSWCRLPLLRPRRPAGRSRSPLD